MAWVRYDDQFHDHPKTTAVIAEDPGAIALHALANTWTNGQKHKGFVPSHQPGILICDKTQGAEWAALLVKHRLWHRSDSMCPDCKEEYADLPDDADGYVFHNAEEYRAPERDRTTPGTPADLSAKRRAAGRKGGKAAASKRQQNQANVANVANGQANQANGAAEDAAPPAVTEAAADGTTGFGGQTAAEDDETAPPAETGDAARATAASGASIGSNLPLAGVSKTSNLPLAGVSPVPVPEPVVASNEATVPVPTEPCADAPSAELTLVLVESAPAKKTRKPRKTKPDRTPEDDQADSLTNGYWERYGTTTAQSWIAVRQVVLTALANGAPAAIADGSLRDELAWALDGIGKKRMAVTGPILTIALGEKTRGNTGRPTNLHTESAAGDNLAEVFG